MASPQFSLSFTLSSYAHVGNSLYIVDEPQAILQPSD